MLNRPVAFAVTVGLLSACRSTPKPGSADPPAAAAESAEVAKLTAQANGNPLLAPWSGPYGGVPPWDQVKADKFPQTFELGLGLLQAEIDAIANNPDPPRFDNVIAALENAGRHENRAEVLFGVLTNNQNTADVQPIDREWSPKIAAAYDKITFNEKLFARISAVYAARETAGLTAERKRLLTRTYDQYVRAGAKLSPDQKKRLGEINQELAVAYSDFGNKVLADENTWVVLDTPADLAGLPDSLRAAYREAAKEKGSPDKWAVVNTRSSVDPFLSSSSRRDLREKVWKAFKSRGDNGNANDTNATIAKIVKLRAERAALLGFASHAHWRMDDTMAKDPQKARDLMM
jgi:peptidyl-dipeptidase Dcp